MKSLVLLCLTLSLVYSQQPPPIWSITGGPMGIGSCYDIVTEAITFPAYKFTYDQQNTMYVRGNTYLIPDQVYGYSSPVFTNDSRIIIMESYQYYFSEYVSKWSISAGATIDKVNLKFAFSHTQGQINALLNNSVNCFAENVLTWTEFVMELWPGEAELNDHFLDYVNKLPETYDPSAYLTFIQEFGTHVMNNAYYGALINFTAVFHSDIIDKTSINWVDNQISLAIGYMQYNVGISWNGFSNHTHINNTFIENSKNVTIITGGQPDVLQSSGFKAWWQTVAQDYAVVYAKSTVVPLYTIVPNPVVAANLKRATIAYGNGKLGPIPKIK